MIVLTGSLSGGIVMIIDEKKVTIKHNLKYRICIMNDPRGRNNLTTGKLSCGISKVCKMTDDNSFM